MTSDDREKISTRNRPDLKTARQPHLSDLLRGPFDIKSVALTGLFVLAVFYTMYFMRAMLLPLVLALLLSYLLAPVVRLLGRLRVNAPFGAAIVLLSVAGLLIYGVSRLAEPVADWLEKAPYSLRQLQQKILLLKRPMEKVAQASGEIEKLTTSIRTPGGDEVFLPVIVLTADANGETKRAALGAGATDFLLKPLDHLEVLLRIANLLEMRRLHIQLDTQRAAFEEALRERSLELREAHSHLENARA